MAKPRRFNRDIDGILLLDKPLGLSSNAALQEARALFGAKKAGHAGSLDPLASGVLPVCFGQATKVCGRLLNAGKSYRVRVRLGGRTETGDLESPVVERAPVPALDEARVDEVLRSFEGEQWQIPPMHSAVKHEGKRLYELARRGEVVERTPRRIVLKDLRRVALEPDVLEFDVHCSKGTYIRTLAADVAERLGTLGYVEALRRLSVDPFGEFPTYTLEQLAALTPAERDRLLLSADVAFRDLPRVDLTAEEERRLLLGQAIEWRGEGVFAGQARAYGGSDRFLGLVEEHPGNRLKPLRLFVGGESTPAFGRATARASGP
jgi:tRNA pseudouridine55 synthase